MIRTLLKKRTFEDKIFVKNISGNLCLGIKKNVLKVCGMSL